MLSIGVSVRGPTNPAGRPLFNELAMTAEFEADFIRVHTCERMQLATAPRRLHGK